MDNLTDRDKTKIRTLIAEKLVDKICDALIEGKPLTQNLRETLGNTMTNVLNEPANKNKISQSMFQSIDSALKMPLRGPLLMYGLLNKDQTYQYVQNYLSLIFNKVYKKNDTIASFKDNLYRQLQNPPYKAWFSQTGGRKRKTIRKKTKHRKRKKNKSNKMHGGNMAASIMTKLAANKNILNKALSNLPSMSSQQSEPSTESKKVREMSGDEIEQNANEMIAKFGPSLFESVTNDIPSISPQILQKMLSASHVHTIKTSDVIVNSAIDALSNTIKTTPMLMDIFPIILVQALYNSGDDVLEALAQALQQQKKDVSDKGDDPSKVTFNPLDPGYMTLFMEKLKERLANRIE